MRCFKKSKHFSKKSLCGVRLIVSCLLLLVVVLSPVAAWPFSPKTEVKTEEQQELIAQLTQAKEQAQEKLDSLQLWLSQYVASSKNNEQESLKLQESLQSSTDLSKTLQEQLMILQTKNEELENLQNLSSIAYSDLEVQAKATAEKLIAKTAESEDYYRQLCDAKAELEAIANNPKTVKPKLTGFVGGGIGFIQGIDAQLITGLKYSHYSVYVTANHKITKEFADYLKDWKFSAGFIYEF